MATHSTSGEEKFLDLPNGRVLAYSDIGDSSSSCLIIFFHGAFNVGHASRLQKELSERNVHYVAPTLPAWGKSSPRKQGVPYHISLASDITALIEHLHPNDPNLKIYISGGSYGTVPAQMLYGASFDIFPFGRNVVGCMVLAPFSPLQLHTDCAKSMSTSTYFSVGPPSQYIPFRLLQRLVSVALKKTTGSLEGAEKFIRAQIFDKMKVDEQEAFKQWRVENLVEEGQLELQFANMMVRSVADTWEGFYEISDVIHSDWGFNPNSLDKDHYANRPIFLVSSKEDTMAPEAMAKWLASSYQNSRHQSIMGGHLAGLFQLNALWKEFFDLCDGT